MVQPGSRLGFAVDALVEGIVAGQVAAEQFDCHTTAEPAVSARMHFGHAAATQELLDLITAHKQT